MPAVANSSLPIGQNTMNWPQLSVKLRGVRQYCSYCDSLFMLTEQNMRFLTVIVETVIRTVVFLSESEGGRVLYLVPVTHLN